MKKIIKVMTAVSLTSITGMQVTACTDNSKYKDFIADVNATQATNSAFLGFLGTKNDDTCQTLETAFDVIQQPDASGKSTFDRWKTTNDTAIKKAGVTGDLSLKSYLGPYSSDKPSDPISDFWYDKSISWQQDIFTWVYSNTKNSDFNIPKSGSGEGVTEIETKKDTSDAKKDMFTVIPIIFIIKNGKLLTAGQGWTNGNTSSQIGYIENFLIENLLTS